MKEPPIPENEHERIETLDGLHLMYSPAEERFDRITRMAQRLLNMPTALISLVGRDVQWFKSIQGFDVAEIPRKDSFCGHAILDDAPLIIPDTRKNEDFADNPLVTGEPGVRFYAGAPFGFEGQRVGTLCVMDTKPRKLQREDIEALQTLASWVEDELKLTSLGEAQVKLVARLDELERRTTVDPITGAWNRRGMDMLLTREFARAKRTNSPMGLLHASVDDFDEIRTRGGTQGVDDAMRQLAARMRSSVRPHDALARCEQREFLIYLADCGSDPAWNIANRILRRVKNDVIEVKNVHFAVSLSIGAASVERMSELALERLNFAAHSALKQARREGGGLVVLKPEVYA